MQKALAAEMCGLEVSGGCLICFFFHDLVSVTCGHAWFLHFDCKGAV